MNKEDYFSELSSILLKYVQFYQKNIIAIIIKNKEFTKEPNKFFYSIVFKICSTLESSNIFIRNFNSHPHYQISLSLLIRSIMSDIILTEYVIHKGRDNTKKIEIINQIYYDHHSNILNTTETVYPLVFSWSKEEKELELSKYKQIIDERFPDNQKKIKSINQIVRELISNSKNSDVIKRAYKLYDEYSKFEHFGDFTFRLIHRGFEIDQFEILNKRLIDTLNIIISALTNYLNLWDCINEYSKQELNDISTELYSFMAKYHDNLS